MTSTGHFNIQQGKRVLVLMKSGKHILAKFKEHKGRFVSFYDHPDLSTSDIRTLSIYRESINNTKEEE